MYRERVEKLTIYAVDNGMRGFTGLKAMKYCETRGLHPELPSHRVHTACQDAAAVWNIHIGAGRGSGHAPIAPAVRPWNGSRSARRPPTTHGGPFGRGGTPLARSRI